MLTTPTINPGNLLFSNDSKKSSSSNEAPPQRQLKPWKVMIVDDDSAIHDVTQMVLKQFRYKDRSLEFVHAYSGKEGCDLAQKHDDCAVMLLDVVMESDTAGLDTVSYIRDTLGNKKLRIILRTGQPGQAPEHKVVRLYDINGYLEKSKLTSQYLEIAMITALRSYDDICTITQLTANNDTLESLVKVRTEELSLTNAKLLQQIREHMQSNEALQRSEAQLAEAQRIARIGHFELDIGDYAMTWSEQVYRILGLPFTNEPHSLDDFINCVAAEDRSAVRDAIEMAIVNNSTYDIEHRIQVSPDQVAYMHQQGEFMSESSSGAFRIVGTLQDVTDRRIAELEMRKLSTAIEQTADGIMITDRQGVIEYVNNAMCTMTGYSKHELIGQTPRIIKTDKQSSAFYQRLWKTIQKGETFRDIVINRHKSGRLYYEEKTITPQKNAAGEIINYISSGRDITERMEAQERLLYLAHHDMLTGLPNRLLLQDRLNQAIARANWQNNMVALLYLDMDRFKVINDTLGHNVGDQILKEMALRLSDYAREGDTIARLGGDEFAIILNDITTTEMALAQANTILALFQAPFIHQEHELFVTTSIGISLYPNDGDNEQTLSKKADAAMYCAKHKGKNAIQLYTVDDEIQTIERLTLESQLRRALDRDEFLLYFQPQLSLSSRRVTSYEALLRWQNSDKKLIPPLNFIPLLEETGLIIPVGEWVLYTACQQEKQFQHAGHTPKKVAVNVSIHQFRHKDFVQMVKRVLDTTKLAPHFLELEVTEGVLIDNIDATAAKLRELHELGISLSIDDFGTGYSSMNYLRRLPFDILKIDRSFVTEVTKNKDDSAIATAIITLAHSLGLEVVAEGVENGEQLCFLNSLGCDLVQGYFYSPPLPANAFCRVDIDQDRRWENYLKKND